MARPRLLWIEVTPPPGITGSTDVKFWVKDRKDPTFYYSFHLSSEELISTDCTDWSGMIFFAKSPTLGDKLLSNFPGGRGLAMGRGSFHAKVLVLFIKNGRLPLQLIKKYGGNAGGLSEKVL